MDSDRSGHDLVRLVAAAADHYATQVEQAPGSVQAQEADRALRATLQYLRLWGATRDRAEDASWPARVIGVPRGRSFAHWTRSGRAAYREYIEQVRRDTRNLEPPKDADHGSRPRPTLPAGRSKRREAPVGRGSSTRARPLNDRGPLRTALGGSPLASRACPRSSRFEPGRARLVRAELAWVESMTDLPSGFVRHTTDRLVGRLVAAGRASCRWR